jgi:hypothetical protein
MKYGILLAIILNLNILISPKLTMKDTTFETKSSKTLVFTDTRVIQNGQIQKAYATMRMPGRCWNLDITNLSDPVLQCGLTGKEYLVINESNPGNLHILTLDLWFKINLEPKYRLLTEVKETVNRPRSLKLKPITDEKTYMIYNGKLEVWTNGKLDEVIKYKDELFDILITYDREDDEEIALDAEALRTVGPEDLDRLIAMKDTLGPCSIKFSSQTGYVRMTTQELEVWIIVVLMKIKYTFGRVDKPIDHTYEIDDTWVEKFLGPKLKKAETQAALDLGDEDDLFLDESIVK